MTTSKPMRSDSLKDPEEVAESIDSGTTLLATKTYGDRPKQTASESAYSFCRLLGVQVAAFVGAGASYLVISRLPNYYRLQQESQGLNERNSVLHEENRWLHQHLHKQLAGLKKRNDSYQRITGSEGYQLPEMYRKVREQTIWSYWHHPSECSSSSCALPEHIRLCSESVKLNKGSFDYTIVHVDEVFEYVNQIELPMKWIDLGYTQQRDALMNALLARYGGVALDLSVLLVRTLDDQWAEMVSSGATFRGYMYRINGQPWQHAEATVAWFLMSRREGIFSAAVRHQLIGMGDRNNTGAYHRGISALGDQTLLPILSMINYTLPKCYDDTTVFHRWACPEHESRPWFKGLSGPARNDIRILLRDPRDGPQLPFGVRGMEGWIVSNATNMSSAGHRHGHASGSGCGSMKECWEDVFLRRYHMSAEPGQARLLDFIKLTIDVEDEDLDNSTEKFASDWSAIISNRQSFFYNWLKLAGLQDFS